MYEVNKKSTVICNGVKYPGGSLLPANLPDIDSLLAAGVITEVPSGEPARPEPVPAGRTFTHSGYDPKDASTVSNVPLRLMPAMLASVSSADLLLEMHEADSRKGGKDLIEERLGELEASDD